MSQVSKYPLSKETYDRIFEIFLKTLINIKGKDEGNSLISDFFTPTERIMFAKRLGIALLLEKGYGYQVIKGSLKVSSATIASVNQARKYGKNSYHSFITKILRDEQVSAFLEDLALKFVSLPASGTKGSAVWKKIEKGIESKKRKKSILLQ